MMQWCGLLLYVCFYLLVVVVVVVVVMGGCDTIFKTHTR
jgi:hypothetical protein